MISRGLTILSFRSVAVQTEAGGAAAKAYYSEVAPPASV